MQIGSTTKRGSSNPGSRQFESDLYALHRLICYTELLFTILKTIGKEIKENTHCALSVLLFYRRFNETRVRRSEIRLVYFVVLTPTACRRFVAIVSPAHQQEHLFYNLVRQTSIENQNCSKAKYSTKLESIDDSKF